ncbi:superinfection immunity protein [Azotobacter vinelandii]|uniref:superinfection immunity protein n=1 Tax=Azotobacter vinelandii TaxID=354 RepID=UPI0026670980|nr:superinfection immunity protein [Azotobacter vinelandii]WKN20794.1 superinfection immunity protein [Azotobacter vinelandii]
MFAVRFLILAFFAFYSYSMGMQPGELNSFGKLIASSVVFFIPALYMLPTIEAWLRKHENLASIALLNLFLGWSLIGWVAALVWAFKRQAPTGTAGAQESVQQEPEKVRQTKICPYCAEEVQFAAVKCKHCKSELPST